MAANCNPPGLCIQISVNIKEKKRRMQRRPGEAGFACESLTCDMLCGACRTLSAHSLASVVLFHQ